MPASLSYTVLEKDLTMALNSLARLNKANRDEATQLIARIRGFIRQIRPDLFSPVQCECGRIVAGLTVKVQP